MVRHARLTLTEEELDELHTLKRRLGRERGRRMNLGELLHEAVGLLLQRHVAKCSPGVAAAHRVPEEVQR